jgi:hypothetical protein
MNENFKRLTPVISIAFFLLAGIFAYLWWQERSRKPIIQFTPDNYFNLSFDQKDTLKKVVQQEYMKAAKQKYDLDTAPLDTGAANPMYRAFRDSTYRTCLNNKDGIYHELDKLIYYFTYWKDSLNATMVDFRFAQFPFNYPELDRRNMFSVIVYPIDSKKKDVGPIIGKSWSYPVDLGDLHP